MIWKYLHVGGSQKANFTITYGKVKEPVAVVMLKQDQPDQDNGRGDELMTLMFDSQIPPVINLDDGWLGVERYSKRKTRGVAELTGLGGC